MALPDPLNYLFNPRTEAPPPPPPLTPPPPEVEEEVEPPLLDPIASIFRLLDLNSDGVLDRKVEESLEQEHKIYASFSGNQDRIKGTFYEVWYL